MNEVGENRGNCELIHFSNIMQLKTEQFFRRSNYRSNFID